MRHQKKKVTLDRKAGPRRALLTGLAESVILYERVRTTKAKAKAVRPLVERLITKAKAKDINARRQIAAILSTQNALRKLMDDLGPRYKDRSSGYTRMTALGERKGDGAQEAIIELV